MSPVQIPMQYVRLTHTWSDPQHNRTYTISQQVIVIPHFCLAMSRTSAFILGAVVVVVVVKLLDGSKQEDVSESGPMMRMGA